MGGILLFSYKYLTNAHQKSFSFFFLFSFGSFFPKSCLKVGGVAYTRVFTVRMLSIEKQTDS